MLLAGPLIRYKLFILELSPHVNFHKSFFSLVQVKQAKSMLTLEQAWNLKTLEEMAG